MLMCMQCHIIFKPSAVMHQCAKLLWRCLQVGLKLMQDDGKVFSCYTNMWDTIFYSELGRCRLLSLPC